MRGGIVGQCVCVWNGVKERATSGNLTDMQVINTTTGELVFIAISCYAIQLQLIRDPSDRLPGPQFSARDGNLLYWNSLRVVNNAHPSDWARFESKGVTSNRVASFVSYLRMWRSPTHAPQCESDNSKLSPFFFYTG